MKLSKIYPFLYLIGLVAIAVIILHKPTPSVEVSAEANATSTIIVPTSTRTIMPVEAPTSTVSRETPQIINVYNTVQKEEAKEPAIEPAAEPTAEPIEEAPTVGNTFVPTPVYTEPYIEPYIAPEPIEQPYIAPVAEPEPTIQPVTETVIEPVEEKDKFTVSPSFRDIEYQEGIRAFLTASWTGGAKGSIICNNIYQYKGTIRSGQSDAYISYKNLKDQFGSGIFVHCRFSVPDIGGADYTLTTP